MDDIRYDPRIIRDFANRLYAAATLQVVVASITGLVIGLFFGGTAAALNRSLGPWLLLALAATGLGLGYFFGSARANALRLAAQLALCQVVIEENTRPKRPESAEMATRDSAATAALFTERISHTTTSERSSTSSGVEGTPMDMPPGTWSPIPTPPPGAYQILDGDSRKLWVRDALDQTVQLEQRSSGIWMASSPLKGMLLNEEYKWAGSDSDPLLFLLVLDDHPLALLRRV